MKRFLLLACLLLATGISPAESVDPTVQLMLRQYDTWQARNRLDLARKTLDKLLIVAPDNPAALTRLALLEISENHPEAAEEALKRLITSHPDHAEITNIRQMLRLAGSERARLQQARLLAKSGQTEQAIAAYEALFPEGPPTDQLAFEYWRQVGNTHEGRQRGLNGLRALVAKYPNHPKYRLALLELELAEDPRDRAALDQLIPFTLDPRFKSQALDMWRRAVNRLDATPRDIPFYREYLSKEPGNEVIRSQLALAESRQQGTTSPATPGPAPHRQHPTKLTGTPRETDKQRGLSALEQGHLNTAWRTLSRAYKTDPNDGEVIGALGLIRLRQGRHGEATELFKRAQRLDSSNRSKWQSLTLTARFWALLRQADGAEAKGQYARAASLIEQALRVDPGNAHGLAALAKVRLQQQRPAAAEQLYRQALRQQPDNSTALRGLIAFEIDQGRLEPAEQRIDSLSQDQRRALGNDLPRLQADLYRTQADHLITAGHLGQATAKLERALQLTPDDPWLHFHLAKLYAHQGQAQTGLDRFEQALARDSQQPDLLYANALFLESLDQEARAVELLRRIPAADRSANMRGTLARLHTTEQLRQAREHYREGEHAHAHHLLGELEKGISDYPGQLLRIARTWSELEADDQASALLDRLNTLELGDGQDDIRAGITLQRARLLRRQQQYAQALALLDGMDIPETSLDKIEEEKATLYQAMGNHLAAAAIYQRRLLRQPDAIDTRFALARVWSAVDEADRAAMMLREIEPRLQATDIDGRLALANAWSAIGETAHAKRLLDALLADYPDKPVLLLRLADNDSDPDRSLMLLKRARSLLAGSPATAGHTHPSFDELEQRIALLQAERSLVFSTSLKLDDRNSTNGKSTLTSVLLPMELRGPAPEGAEWFVRIEPVSLDAGDLDLTEAEEINTFGQGLFCFPACPYAESDQSAKGVAFGIGYQRENLRLDIGTTPVGFLVEDIIGGVKLDGDLGDFSWGVDLSRRPMSGTLLTLAGTRDPNSGEIWGGVRANGVTFRLSHDLGGSFGFWSNLGLHYLEGENVADNRRARLMAGTYWKFINEADRRLSIGLNTGIWRHAKALDEFTFGHGGYYSPNRYFSLSLPVNFYARHNKHLSYRLSGSISQSWSHEDRTAYFPDDTDLQSAAEAQQLTTGVDPYYEGGAGGGFGYSVEAVVEYKVNNHLTLGLEANTEQSDFYAPNRASFYLRYSFDKDPRPVRLPPQPLEPYLDF